MEELVVFLTCLPLSADALRVEVGRALSVHAEIAGTDPVGAITT